MDPEYTVIGRVARRIWAVAMRDRYGANERSQKLKYHVQTSGRSLHAQEMAFNDIRTTLQALCAIYDNANSLHTNAYDEAVTTPTAESVRRALAIQLIINQEWGLASNENPLQGCFIVEELTDLVEEAVLAEFERISERGGVLGAMETGYQRGRIQDESMLYEHASTTAPCRSSASTPSATRPATPCPTTSSWPAPPRRRSRASSRRLARLPAPPTPATARPRWPGSRTPPSAARTSSPCSWTPCGSAAWARSPSALFEVGGRYRRNVVEPRDRGVACESTTGFVIFQGAPRQPGATS